MTYPRDTVLALLEAQPTTGPTRWLALDLEPGETAWNAGTGPAYTGPGCAVYGLYASGKTYSTYDPEGAP